MGNEVINKVEPKKEVEKKPKPTKKLAEQNLIWHDRGVNSEENLFYQSLIKEKFNLYLFTNVKESVNKLKTILFQKTYILVSGSLSKVFFFELEKIINEIMICPIIIIFTSRNKFDIIKKNILGLDNFSFFDMNLVHNDFFFIQNLLLLENKYKIDDLPNNDFSNYDDCFTFEYINELKDLILPLTFTEFIKLPSKDEIFAFNQFLIGKYQKTSMELKNLINQLLVDTPIPIPILVKYWVRLYTLESKFYGEMNYTLIKKLNNDFDIYIRVLYQGLKIKAIKPLIDYDLYRGSIIKLKEINYIKESLKRKRKIYQDVYAIINHFYPQVLIKKLLLFIYVVKNQMKMKLELYLKLKKEMKSN